MELNEEDSVSVDDSIDTSTVIEDYVKSMTEDHKLKDEILKKTLMIYNEAKELQESMKKWVILK